MGWTYYLEWNWRWNTDPQTLERALALAQQALALDDALPWAYSLLAMVYAQKRQYTRAIAEGERAIALNPNDADSYTAQAETLLFAGRPEEALRAVVQAIRLNPRSSPWYLVLSGTAYRALRLNPKFSLEVHKHRLPVRDPAVLERHIAALRKAGLK